MGTMQKTLQSGLTLILFLLLNDDLDSDAIGDDSVDGDGNYDDDDDFNFILGQ